MSEQSPDNSVRSRPILERHVQTIMLGLVIALLAWSGTTTLKLVETSARQDERITQLINITNELRDEMRDASSRYMTVNSASVYRQQLNSRIDSIDIRVKQLEDSL
ncbi:hypothetical protein MRB56_09165 [Halomonas cupida]|uniref:hypothetical protein n=1 Tax=Halomonas cupida TaxID=44933 RepID=UPI0039B61182